MLKEEKYEYIIQNGSPMRVRKGYAEQNSVVLGIPIQSFETEEECNKEIQRLNVIEQSSFIKLSNLEISILLQKDLMQYSYHNLSKKYKIFFKKNNFNFTFKKYEDGLNYANQLNLIETMFSEENIIYSLNEFTTLRSTFKDIGNPKSFFDYMRQNEYTYNDKYYIAEFLRSNKMSFELCYNDFDPSKGIIQNMNPAWLNYTMYDKKITEEDFKKFDDLISSGVFVGIKLSTVINFVQLFSVVEIIEIISSYNDLDAIKNILYYAGESNIPLKEIFIWD